MDKKIDYNKAFEGCSSHLEAPLMAEVIKPTCYQCKNLVWPENPFHPNTCKIFGEIPSKYWQDNTEKCPHKETEN